MTNKVEMQGMNMPAMTSKVCMPKGGERDPRNANTDKECEMTDVKVSGNKSSWKMRCTKDGDVITGTGEMTAGVDRNEGVMTMNSKHGNMTMSYVNKRLGGACDPDEMKKKAEAMLAAGNKASLQQCESSVKAGQWILVAPTILAKDSPCAGLKDQMCETMKRDAGSRLDIYFLLKRPDPAVAKSCGVAMDAAKKSICKSIDINNAAFNKQIRDSGYQPQLKAECPAEMKIYAEASRKRFCEGRGFTEQKRVSMADCLKGVSGDDEGMNTPDPQEPPVSGSNSGSGSGANKSGTEKPKDGLQIPGLPGNSIPTDAVIDGAKKLKNLFGF
jgi:hypothetical protein